MATQADYRKTIGNNVNEANLTDQELQDRLSAYQGLGNTTGTTDRMSVQRAIAEKLKAYGVNTNTDAVAGRIAEMVDQLGRYPNADELKQAFATDTQFSRDSNKPVGSEASGPSALDQSAAGVYTVGGSAALQGWNALLGGNKDDLYTRGGYIPPALENFFNDQNARNELSDLVSKQVNAPDTSADVSRVGDLLATRKQQATNENDLQSYINQLPDALAQGRDQYVQALQGQGQQQFNDVLAPQALQSANSRGMLFSGDVGDALATGAGNIQSNIEQAQSDLASQDYSMYFNAAYQNTLRQQLNGQNNYSQFLAGERQRVLDNQQTQFGQEQTKLNASNQNDVQMQNYQNQLRAQQVQFQRQQDYANSQRTANLYGQIEQAGGGIAMTAVGAATSNPWLTAAGIGSFGGALPGIAPTVGGH